MEELNIQRDLLYVSPIAEPLAGEKLEEKLYKLTKKFINLKLVKRGVKEVGKSIRKGHKGLVILAADISPPDVLSHLPV
jgi:H/ACA ribonucleoprotein complex subunit 2